MGRPILLAELLTRPDISLIKQSYSARERVEPLNGDGFGVGWYAPELDPVPCLFTCVTPAWNNRNLHRLAEKVVSPCVFAHVRAATPGMLVCEANCHPFQQGRLMWMHNGNAAYFNKFRRRRRASLSDSVYNSLQGSTDSEHAFALFMNRLENSQDLHPPERLARAMVATIKQLNDLSAECGVGGQSFYNFAVTDGRSVVATRYASEGASEPA